MMAAGSGVCVCRGVLSVWAAKAGAARVVAVEFTDMAKHAQTVVNKNGVGHIVTVSAATTPPPPPHEQQEGGGRAEEEQWWWYRWCRARPRS